MAKPTKSDLQSEILAINSSAEIEGLTVDQLKELLAKIKDGDAVQEDTSDEITDIEDDEITGDDNIIDDVLDEEDDEGPSEPMIIVKSKYKGIVYGMPMGNPKELNRSAESRSMFTHLGYNEVILSVWEAMRKECLKNGFTEHGRKVDSKGNVTAKQFNEFDPKEQLIIARNSNDIKALKRWKTLPGLDASVMSVVTERISKIVNWKPGA
jgi:hypothetical protein